MALAAPPLTYEAYMAEPVLYKRYDIIDGERRIMPNPTRRHQDIQGNIYMMLRGYQADRRTGRVVQAPCDVLIRRSPLRTRQPDVLFMSNTRLAQNGDDTDPTPLDPAPELVFEVLSPSDSFRTREEKLLDYCRVGVEECWLVDEDAARIEVLKLEPDGYTVTATYEAGSSARSLVFPDLILDVDEILAH